MMNGQEVRGQPIFWSQTQKYQIHHQVFTNQNLQHKQISPFQNVNILERKAINSSHAQERSLKSSAIHSELNTKNNPQHFLYEESQPKQYQEKPFGKIRNYRPEQLQIVVPLKSYRGELTYSENYDYSCMTNRSNIEGQPQQGGKKKKMSVVSKCLISETKIC